MNKSYKEKKNVLEKLRDLPLVTQLVVSAEFDLENQISFGGAGRVLLHSGATWEAQVQFLVQPKQARCSGPYLSF